MAVPVLPSAGIDTSSSCTPWIPCWTTWASPRARSSSAPSPGTYCPRRRRWGPTRRQESSPRRSSLRSQLDQAGGRLVRGTPGLLRLRPRLLGGIPRSFRQLLELLGAAREPLRHELGTLDLALPQQAIAPLLEEPLLLPGTGFEYLLMGRRPRRDRGNPGLRRDGGGRRFRRDRRRPREQRVEPGRRQLALQRAFAQSARVRRCRRLQRVLDAPLLLEGEREPGARGHLLRLVEQAVHGVALRAHCLAQLVASASLHLRPPRPVGRVDQLVHLFAGAASELVHDPQGGGGTTPRCDAP